MKLHDHPLMQVVSYIMEGEMEAKLYSQIEKNTFKKNIIKLKTKDVTYIDGILTKENNLHEFTAIQPTFFLDILFPDYNKHK